MPNAETEEISKTPERLLATGASDISDPADGTLTECTRR